MKNDVSISEAVAVDVTKLHKTNSAGRTIVCIGKEDPKLDGFLFTHNNKSIFIIKDVISRNLKGPERRDISIW